MLFSEPLLRGLYSGHLTPGSPSPSSDLEMSGPQPAPTPHLPILLCGLPDLGLPLELRPTPPPKHLIYIRLVLRSTRRPQPACHALLSDRGSAAVLVSASSLPPLLVLASARPPGPTPPLAAALPRAPDPAARPAGEAALRLGVTPDASSNLPEALELPRVPHQWPQAASSRVCVQIPAGKRGAVLRPCREMARTLPDVAPHPRQTPHSRKLGRPPEGREMALNLDARPDSEKSAFRLLPLLGLPKAPVPRPCRPCGPRLVSEL